MRDRIPFAVLLASAVTAGTLALAALVPVSGTHAGSASAGAVLAEMTYDVDMLDTGLAPITVTVGVSDSVRWTNRTTVTRSTVHKAEGGDTAVWNSLGMAPEGGEFTFRFEQAGVYPYHDLYHAGDTAFFGAIVVTETKVTNVTPTVSPSATDEPTPTSEPTITPIGPTAQPTPIQVNLTGKLLAPEPGDQCTHDARLERCHSGEIFRVRSESDISGLIGLDVVLDGVVAQCESGGGDFVQLDTIQVNPGGCGTPPPPPPPTPTPEPKPNLAAAAPISFSDEVPGFPAANAVDGDVGTLWRSDRTATWIYLDLGRGEDRNLTFNEMVLHWGEKFATRYAVYVFENGDWYGVYQTIAPGDGGEDKISLPRVFGRFVLLYLIESNNPGQGYSLGEWEIYGREGINQARGGAVVVSSAQIGHPAVHAIDGDRETYWAAEPGDPNPWIRIHLPGAYVADIRLYWLDKLYPEQYTTINYDGSREIQLTWTSLGPTQQIALPSSIRTDAFLLYTRSKLPQSDHIAIYELELYEPGASSATNAAIPVGARLLPNPDLFSTDDRFGRWRGGRIGDVPHEGVVLPDGGTGASAATFDAASIPSRIQMSAGQSEPAPFALNASDFGRMVAPPPPADVPLPGTTSR